VTKGSLAEAENSLLQAIETSDRQGALAFRLRAATSLGRLWRDQNRHSEARSLLAPIYSQFTEGLDTPDLKDAKVLLDSMDAADISDL
jgi:predicted ATPase